MNLFNDMKKFDQKIREGKQLSDNEIAELSTMLLKIRDEPRKEEPLDIT
jgi:hypothetical protein